MRPSVDDIRLYTAQHRMAGVCFVCGANHNPTELSVEYSTVGTVYQFSVPVCRFCDTEDQGYDTSVRWNQRNVLSYRTWNKIYRRMDRLK
jgi:hypothetical protein